MAPKSVFLITLLAGLCLSSSDAATFEDWLRGQITPICGASEAKFVDNYVLSLEYLYTWQAFLNNKAGRIPTLVSEISRHNVFMAPQFSAALRAAETQTMAAYNNFLAQGNLSINETVEAANAKVFINAHYFMDEIVWEPGKILIETANTNQARAFECSAQVIPDFTKFIEESFNLGIQCTNNFFVNYDEAFNYIKRADIKLVNSNFYIRRCTNRSFTEIAPCLNQLTPVVPSTANDVSDYITKAGNSMADENAKQLQIFKNCLTQASLEITAKAKALSSTITSCVSA